MSAARVHGLNRGEQRFYKEAIMWKHMSWPYILEFNGVFYHNGVPAIVTPWMLGGNITEYLEEYTVVERFRLASSSVPPVSDVSSL